MGGWGVSRVRRVGCGAVLLPVSSVAVSSASVIWYAWAARCRLRHVPCCPHFPYISSMRRRIARTASSGRIHTSVSSAVAGHATSRRVPFSSASHILLMAAALPAAVAFLAPHFAPRHPSPSLSSAGCLRFAFALQFRQ